ncbi:carboxynorspermidine decarboxylase [Reichenbachiella versicolor]|uniref:carboxynorspermidine decarboxylase n=1 Tax=Reichenbachiella versicolor TaxID=1821036 RepID=UPI0016250523|nr:carboxynorspermidine decarboxylase [Reichenbachiella versicolor]
MSASNIPSPCFVLQEELLEKNLQRIKSIADEAGVEFILAFKGFAMWSAFPLVRQYINGATASSLNEAKLCNDYMNTKSHTYCVAYREEEMDEILKLSSHITFNSLSQLSHYHEKAQKAGVGIGLRINPEFSDVETDLYNPASPSSRLGVTENELKDGLSMPIDGIHTHVLCESSAESLEGLLNAVEQKFGHLLPHIKWLNIGGGHLVTRKNYNVELLVHLLKNFKAKHGVEIILEPGSAFAWETGTLHTSVLDIVERNGVKTAIIDASFTCHMPDCLEMPYRPNLEVGSSDSAKYDYKYRLGGVSCLAGDYLEEYSFPEPLVIGSPIVFKDMIHYTMVKTTTFNGVHHPSIGIAKKGGGFQLIKEFGYEEYRDRLS